MIVRTGECLNCGKYYGYAIKSIYDYPDSVVHKCENEGEGNE
jgi:hypothetical protein